MYRLSWYKTRCGSFWKTASGKGFMTWVTVAAYWISVDLPVTRGVVSTADMHFAPCPSPFLDGHSCNENLTSCWRWQTCEKGQQHGSLGPLEFGTHALHLPGRRKNVLGLELISTGHHCLYLEWGSALRGVLNGLQRERQI